MEAFVFSPFAVLSLHVTKLWNSAQFNWQSSRLCCVLGGTGRIQQRWRRVRPHRREEVRGRPGGFGQLDEERKKSKGQDSISWESVYNRKFLPNPQIHQLHQYSGSSCRGRNCYQREKKKGRWFDRQQTRSRDLRNHEDAHWTRWWGMGDWQKLNQRRDFMRTSACSTFKDEESLLSAHLKRSLFEPKKNLPV